MRTGARFFVAEGAFREIKYLANQRPNQNARREHETKESGSIQGVDDKIESDEFRGAAVVDEHGAQSGIGARAKRVEIEETRAGVSTGGGGVDADGNDSSRRRIPG